ncbi:hypothetical protein PHMEG_00032184 [Phytophthora megakarya]|uniref:RNase H type-1 domain-containing protein n=1 Tax=Phytophthora megakarya TaxID=4795 RepID=A0A225UW35_9STRA|nr:hypothetical protein PHMEG_00032184 [Phytophthora megakarya]
MKLAEEAAKHQQSLDDDSDFTLTTTRTKFEVDRQASSELDPVLRMVNDPYADMFATNEPDESLLVPMFQRRSFVDDICFGGTTFDDCLDTLDKLLVRFEECRINVSFTKSIFCQSKVAFLSHEVSPEGIRADPKKMTAITKLPFPKSKKGMQQFLGSLNYYSRFIQDFEVYGVALYQLKEYNFFEGGDLAAAKESFTALQRKVAEAPILRHFDAKKGVHIVLYANELALSATLMQMHDDNYTLLLYAQLPQDYEGFVVSFDGSAKTEKNGDYGSCSWVLWKLPGWQIVIAASAYLEQTTVNMAEYSSMNHGVIAALEHGAEDLVIVGDSRLAIQQSLGVIACRKDSLMTPLNHHRELVAKLKSVRYLHVVREYNAAADSLAGEALVSKVSKVVLIDHRKTELKELNRTQEMIYEPSSDDIKAENTSLVPRLSLKF